METDKFLSLQWKQHKGTIVSTFEKCFERNAFVDCTLAAEGQYLNVHKVILTACSPYFDLLLSQNQEKHPIIILQGVTFQQLKSIVNYMYCGFATVSLSGMKDLLAAAESLQIKGLSKDNEGLTRGAVNEMELRGPHPLPAASTEMPLAAARSTRRSSLSYERNAAPRESLEGAQLEETVGFNEPWPKTEALGDHTASPSSPALPQPLSSSRPPPLAALVGGVGAIEPERSPPKRMEKGILALPLTQSPIPSTSVSHTETNISPEREPPAAWEDAETVSEPTTVELSDSSDESGELEADEEGTPGSPRHSSRSTTATGSTAKPGVSEPIHHSMGTGNQDPENLHQEERVMREGACLVDGAVSPTAADGMRTPRRRPRKHRCFDCTKSFLSPSELRIHLRTHTGQRPYQCNRCPKAFTVRSNLSVHLRTHTGERPYQCAHCPKTFAQRNYLSIHQRTHTGERPYQCPHCPNAFAQRNNLRIHLRRHTGERPYQCVHCLKTFAHRNSLSYHLRTHTGERPYQCAHCPKAFARLYTMKEHLRIHTGQRPDERRAGLPSDSATT